MDQLVKEIEECQKRIGLLEKFLSGNLNVDSLKASADLVEAKLRLKLLEKQKADLERPRKRHAVDDVDFTHEGAYDLEGCGGDPDYSSIDTSKPRTLAEIGWLQDIQDLKKGGDIIHGSFEGKPLSHFLKLSNPVDKGSSSRGTAIFESSALITNVEDAVDPETLISMIFTHLLQRAFAGHSKPPDLINMQFFGDGMVNPYYVPMRSPEMNNVDALTAQFMHLSTSDTLSSIFNNQVALKICGYWSPSGSGCTHDNIPKVVNCENKEDNFCLARALCYGKKYIETGGVLGPDYLLNGLSNDTLELMEKSGLDMNKCSYSLIDAQKLLEILGKEYRLIVYDEYHQVIFNGPYAKNVLILQLKNNHFDYVPKLHLFLNIKKVCLQCLKEVHAYSHPKGCEKLCFYCMRSNFDTPCRKEGLGVFCPDCSYTFANKNCFEFHKLPSKIKQHTLCSMRKICAVCGKCKYTRDKRHNCENEVDSNICQNCEFKHTVDKPFCFIQPKTPKCPKRVRFAFIDIECFTDALNHEPITLYCIVICSVCIAAEIDPNSSLKEAPKECCCGSFDSRHHFFNGYDGGCPVKKFLDFLFKRSTKQSDSAKTIVLAHNNSKYDGHLILNELYRRNLAVDVVCQGFKLFSIEVKLPGKGAFVFKDTLNFFMAPLKALPAMFDFSEDASKEYFAHGWNKRNNLHVSLPGLPDVEYFWPDKMKPSDREKFLIWYEMNKATPFCLARDLKSYNKSDVIVLMMAALKFREIMLEITGICPFTSSTTIASYAFNVFRANFLKPNMLVNVHERGYRRNELQSEEALRFLRLYEIEKEVVIRDASWSCGEFKIPNTNFKVDGVIQDSSGNVVKCIEYNNCYFHGCLKCYKPEQILAGGIRADVLHERTIARAAEIESKYVLESYWSCDFNERIKHDRKLKAIYNNIHIPPRLQLRDSALKGGRVECFKMYYKCKPEEQMIAIDVNSLYPDTQKHGIFPIGNPQVLTHESFKNVEWTNEADNIYKGFILGKVLPPKEIKSKSKIPLLAYSSSNGNLVFGLCRTCADQESRECGHNEDERAWVAAYTHLELNKALKLGYKIVEIYEIWDYPEFSEPGTNKDIFGEYCNVFLKLKCESSGWVCGDDPAERENYVREYENREGIKLEPAKISVNNGKRSVSKLMANALWGKLAQRTNLSKIEITKTAQAFHMVMSDNTVEILDITHINDSTDRIVTRKKEEFRADGKSTCLSVAAFVTSQARLKLYEFMELVDGIIFYVDTDSIYYLLKKGEKPVPVGKFLGEMTREHANMVIKEFVCAGPKNYGMLMEDASGKESAVIKVRGFPLNYDASQLITFNEMKKKVFEKFKQMNEPEPIAVDYSIIKRSKHATLSSVDMKKKWMPVCHKGFVDSDFNVHAWGSKNDS